MGPRRPAPHLAAESRAMSPDRLKRKRKALDDRPWIVLLTMCSILTINAFTAPLTPVSSRRARRESTGMHAKLLGRDGNKNLTLAVFPPELDRRHDASDVSNEVQIEHFPPSSSEFDVDDEGEAQEPEHSYNGPLSESVGGGANEGGSSSSPQEGEGEQSFFEKFALQNDLVTASDRLLRSLDTTSSSYTPRPDKSFSDLARLSKAHHSLLSKTSNMRRQRFVTGKYPLYVSVKQNPTKKWLGLAESQIYLNGTSIEKSLASYDIFNWLDHNERQELHDEYEFLSLELLAEIHVRKPGDVNILPRNGAGRSLLDGDSEKNGGFWKSWKLSSDLSSQIDANLQGETEDHERLWMTGFHLTKQRGELHSLNVENGELISLDDRTSKAIKWPNEVASIPTQSSGELEDALLVTDGFLVPGKDKGGLYVVRNPGNPVSEWRVSLTGITNLRDETLNTDESNWFYHRAIFMDLTGDGRKSILAARAKFPLLQGGNEDNISASKGGKGELVWLERPRPHSYDDESGTPLDKDGTVFDPFNAKNTPWKLRVLDEGPDVMFSVADLDADDDTVEIIASQFFGKRLTLHSLQIGVDPKIVFRRVIDHGCGSAFSSVLADLDGLADVHRSEVLPRVVDCGSTIATSKEGDAFSHVLVTSHECSYADSVEGESKSGDSNNGAGTRQLYDGHEIDGGSLFAYRIPNGRGNRKSQPWRRSVVATGFKVQGQINNMISPGAPGFAYTFFPTLDTTRWRRPLIGLAGDCAESAYILKPVDVPDDSRDVIEEIIDKSAKYNLMCEIKCEATVGSLAVGYEDLHANEADQQSGYAKIYVPCYEKDQVLVFSMGSGVDYADADDNDDDDGW